jgi:hypothetical protein
MEPTAARRGANRLDDTGIGLSFAGGARANTPLPAVPSEHEITRAEPVDANKAQNRSQEGGERSGGYASGGGIEVETFGWAEQAAVVRAGQKDDMYSRQLRLSITDALQVNFSDSYKFIQEDLHMIFTGSSLFTTSGQIQHKKPKPFFSICKVIGGTYGVV